MNDAAHSHERRLVAAGPTTWFQAYLPGEVQPITTLVNRVAAAGFET